MLPKERSEGAHHVINRKTAGKEGIPLLDSSVLFILTSSNELYLSWVGWVPHFYRRFVEELQVHFHRSCLAELLLVEKTVYLKSR
jgi:hypothetical protein